MSIEVVTNIYIRDTLPLVLKRIAAKVNSLPKYLKPVEEIDLNPKNNVKILINDLFFLLKTAKNFKDISELVKSYEDNLSLINDIIKPYIYFRVDPSPDIEEDKLNLIVFSRITEVNKVFPDVTINFENYNLERELFISNLERDISFNKKQSDEYIQNLEKQKAIVGKEFTKFELEKIKYIIVTNIKDSTIYEVFDALTLTSKFPLAYVNDYYKIFKDFSIPEQSWIERKLENVIVLKSVDDINILLYIEDNVLKIGFDIRTAQNLNIEVFTKEIVSLLSIINPSVTEEKQVGINGVYYIPHQTLNKYVFSHLVLNDSRFSNILYIDESARATKTKEGIAVVYNNGIDEVSFVLTDKTVDRYDPDVRDKPEENFPENDPYLRVKISRAKNKELVAEFSDIFSKIITMYNESYNEVVKFYRKFLPDFGEKKVKLKEKVEKKKRFLKDIVPDMFTARYRKSCGHPPRIVEKEEADTLDDVILYPKTSEEGKQHYYTCDDETFKHVGLAVNTDPATAKYAFVPCCYPQDQKIKGVFSNYNEYYHGFGVERGPGKQQKFIKTNKILSYEIYGSLEPFENVNMFFDGINVDEENYHYIRFGVDRSKFSFVQCVFEALEKSYKNKGKSKEDRLEEIYNEIMIMTEDDALMSSARQEFPDKSVEKIKEMMLDKETYINPKLFIRILENFYECKIYIFSSETLEIPNHLKNYITNENNEKVVIIIEHIGSTSDRAVYPQCEVIIKSNKFKADDITFNFEKDSVEVMNLRTIFSKLVNSYYLSQNVKESKIEKELLLLIDKQIINSYGKTSALIVKRGNFCLYLKEPIQPLNIVEEVKEEFTVPELSEILYFVKQNFITSIQKIVDENGFINILILRTNIDNVYYVPIQKIKNDDRKYPFLLSSEKVSIPFYKNFSGLTAYNQNKKLARYLQETFLYQFSKFINEGELDINEVRNIVRFVEQKVVIDKDIRYGFIPKRFDVSDEGLMRDNKLLLMNNEVLKRLVYCLRLELSRNTENVINYYKKKNIENYIKDLSDFRMVKSQIILFGKESVESYIKQKTETYTMNRKLILSSVKPFFFKNYLLGENNVYIAFNFGEDLDDGREFIYKTTGSSDHGVFNYINSETINFIRGERDVSCILIVKENEESPLKYFVLLKV